ncbi:MAG TPA: tetratricopeptide repeat protein, partial [Longimicrobium sp.]|nr:tetratricopeptide repeat protein [Longimicrobium sp.]
DPAGAQEQDVMTACRQAADWAEQRGLLATALAFATAAALVSPTDAAAAARIGRVARMRAENARAETWYRRTIALARRSGDWLSYSEAFLRLGNLYRLRGNFPVARRFYLRGLRAARRHALREVQGGALHGLFSVSREAYPPAEAQELARQAFQVYGPGHPQLPDLAHQVAHFWMIQGWFAPALDVFRALVSHFHDSSVRLGHLANVVFTAGAVGDRAAFEVAWEEMWDAAAEWDRMPLAPLLLLTVAGGARRLRDWARVERAAETARDVAEREWMGWVVKEAERVLDAARRRQAVEEAPVAASEGLEDTGSFAAELVSSLRKVTAE